jgi:hypothetical protein
MRKLKSQSREEARRDEQQRQHYRREDPVKRQDSNRPTRDEIRNFRSFPETVAIGVNHNKSANHEKDVDSGRAEILQVIKRNESTFTVRKFQVASAQRVGYDHQKRRNSSQALN